MKELEYHSVRVGSTPNLVNIDWTRWKWCWRRLTGSSWVGLVSVWLLKKKKHRCKSLNSNGSNGKRRMR